MEMDLGKQDLDMQFWMENNKIDIAIWMVTYNHEDYIAKAVESVMMQKTNFKYKLFIGEDCSTDKTREICIRLKEKYPEKIKLILQNENIGGIKNAQIIYKTIIESGEKYMALIEGDDYWTDPLKLQKQVDFLEANPEYGMVCTDYHKYYQDSGKYKYNCFKFDKYKNEVKFEDYVFDRSTIGTQTVVLRNSLFVDYSADILNNVNLQFNIGDSPMWLYFAIKSKIKVLKDVTAVYRILNNSFCHFDDHHKHYAFVMKGFEVPDFFLNHYDFPSELIIKNENKKLKSSMNYAFKIKNVKLFNEHYKKIKNRDLKIYLWKFGLMNKYFYKAVQFLLNR